MEDQSNKPLANTIANNQRTSSVIPPGEFNFIPIEEMFETPETDLANVIATDPGAIAQVDRYKADIDKYGIPAMASLGTVSPSLATGKYNPVAQQNPSQAAYQEVKNILTAKKDGPGGQRVAPRYASIRQSNFLRYYEHPEFADLGFTPYANMEEFYNANSTIWDDMSRMSGQFASLAGSGFNSVYRSYGDMFGDGSYLSQPDLESAFEFEDAMAIGNSSRGGALGFTNNLLLNSAYTFGIIGSIAVEELILAGAAAAQGFLNPASDALLASRSVANVKRAGDAISGLFDMKKMADATRNAMKTLSEIDTARDFWAATQGTRKVLGQAFTPNTMYALKNFKSTKNATQNAVNLAKMKAGFGGFYRDFRAVNLALAESKLEGGMVYNELIREGVNMAQAKSGVTVTPEEFASIQSKASEGAFYTTMANAPIIYASNWFVLGNALGGFNRSLGRVFGETFEKGLNGRLFKGKGVKDAATGKVKDVFKDAGTGLGGWWTKVRAGGVKGNTGRALAASARYFAANIAEGIQEVAQEAVSAGTKGYYTALLDDPLAGGVALRNQYIASGMSSQFSGQGAETFLSGFLMGGIVQGPQKLFFQGIPALYQRINDPKAYKEYQEIKDKYVKDLVTVHNKAWNAQADDPGSVFDPQKLNFFFQKQAAAEMKKNVFSQDRFGFQDEKDAAKFHQMYTIFKTGTSELFKNQLRDYLKMTDAELAQAFPSSKADVKSGKIRSRLEKFITQIDKTEADYNRRKDDNKNPFDPSQFNKETEKRQYIQEVLKSQAWEHANYLYMFTENGFQRALERANSIYTELANDPLFDGMAASDVTVLLDPDSISNELFLLSKDILVLDDSTEQGKKDKKRLEGKLERLREIQKVLSDKNLLNNDGTFDKRKLGSKLLPVFEKYIKYLANSKNTFADKSKIKEALKKMIDYGALKGRARVYDKAIEYLANPERFNEIVNRQIEVNKNIYRSLSSDFEKQIKKYLNVAEANELMNQLFKRGYVGDPENVKGFLQTGDVRYLNAMTFFNEQGQIDKKVDKVKYDEIQRLLDVYRNNQEKTEESEQSPKEENQKEDITQAKTAQDQVLDNASIDVILPETNNTRMLNELLKRQYSKYSATQTVLGENVLTFEEWRNSEGAIWQNTFNALKKLWASGKLPVLDAQGNAAYVNVTEDQLLNELGFDAWLKSREVRENDLVSEILQSANVSLDEIIAPTQKQTSKEDITKGKNNVDIYKEGARVNVIKVTTIDENGKPIAFFKLVDPKGNDLSADLLSLIDSKYEGTYPTSKEAVQAQEALEKQAPDNAPFKFDNEELNQGMLVYRNGKEYVVVSTPRSISGGKLRLRINDGSNKVTVVNRGEFAGRFTKQEIKYDFDPTNARVNIEKINQIYPHANTVDGQRNYTEASKRLDLILQILDETDLKNLNLVIEADPNGGVDQGQFTMEGKNPNKYVKVKTSAYRIGLAAGSQDTQKRINDALLKNGIKLSDNSNGIFAYIPNDVFEMIDAEGNPVKNLSTITPDLANSTLFVSKTLRESLTKEEILNLARSNFALNKLITNEATNALAESKGAIAFVPVDKLDFDFSLLVSGGNVVYDNSSVRSLSSLKYQHADENGNYLIYDLKKLKGGKVAETTITNLEGKEARELEAKVEAGLEASGQSGILEAARDRYMAAVLLPNGAYRLVPLKAGTMTAEMRAELAVKLIERAELTKIENLDKKGKEKSLSYNYKYNDNLSEGLFISTKPGYRISLQVDPWGKIQMQLYDKNLGKQVGKTISVQVKDIDLLKLQDDPSQAVTLMQELVTKFNSDEDIQAAEIKLTNKNFRTSFPDAATVNDIINKTTTNVIGQVIDTFQAQVFSSSDVIQAMVDLEMTTVASESQTDPILQEQEEIQDVLSLESYSEEEFKDLENNGFEDISRKQLEVIVDKLTQPVPAALTEREKEVYSYRSDMIDSMEAIKREKENLNQDSSDQLIKSSTDGRSAGVKELISIYVGGNLFFPINATGFEVAESFSANGVTLEEAKAAIPGLDGKLKAWFQRGIDYLEPKQQQTSKLESLKQKLEVLKSELVKDISPKDRRKVLRENEEYQKLLKQVKDIEQKGANKILSPEQLSQSDVTDINAFTKWAEENLPSYINIADINTLGNNMKAGGVRVGAFVLALDQLASGLNLQGTIYTSATSPYKYHEAFHGVFRMLLTDVEINEYINIARKEVRAKLRSEGKSFEAELKKFRNSANTYTNMSESELIREYYEEYLADEFEKFKTDPTNTKTDSSVKSLFTRILDWIKSIFSVKSQNELQTLFQNIDSGKFRNAEIQRNQFTIYPENGYILEANAIVPYASEQVDNKVGYIYLDSDIADPMLRNISAMYLSRTSELKEAYNPGKVLDELIDDFAWLYSPENPINAERSEMQLDKLRQIENAFDNYSQEIKDQVVKFLTSISDNVSGENLDAAEFEDSKELRKTTEYDKDASMIGGFRSLSSSIRQYIATTTLEETDYFGNVELTDGEPLIIAVDFINAYNGLLKAVKSKSDPKAILQSMYFFGQDNAHAGAVVRRILKDVGITEEQLLSEKTLPKQIANPLLFQSILKGFENFRVDYLFNERDDKGNVIIYSAAERDDRNSQLDNWKQAYIYKRKQLVSNRDRKRRLNILLKDISDDIRITNKSITNKKLKEDAQRYSQELFDLVGIKLSPLYLQFNMVYNRSKLTVKQKALLNFDKDANPLTEDLDGKAYKVNSIDMLNLLTKADSDIFERGDEGMDSRLKAMAIGNSSFDETVGATVFKNPNGDLVYAHQMPTYHLRKVAELNDPSKLEALITSDPYLANNFLLNSSAFKNLSKERKLKVLRIAGTKISDLIKANQEQDESLGKTKDSSSYGDYTPQEFTLNLINNYTALLNNRSYKVTSVDSLDKNGNEVLTALAPVLIRVMEASNTGDMINLPVIKTVDFNGKESKITEEVVDIYIDQIRSEFQRIVRESNEKTKTKELIEGYNTPGGRAFQFFNSGLLIGSPALKKQLVEAAINAGKTNTKLTLDEAIEGLVIQVAPTQQTSEVKSENISSKGSEFAKKLTNPGNNLKVTYKEREFRNAEHAYQTYKSGEFDQKAYDSNAFKPVGSKPANTNTNYQTMVDILKAKLEQHPELIEGINQRGGLAYIEESTHNVTGDKFWESKGQNKFIEALADAYNSTQPTQQTSEVDINRLEYAESQEESDSLIARGYTYAGKNDDGLPAYNKPTQQSGEVVGMTGLRKSVVDNLEKEFSEFKQEINELNISDKISKQIAQGPTVAAGVSRRELTKSQEQLNLVTNNPNHNLKQVFFNDWINTMAINEILLGDQAISLSSPVDKIKRAKMQNAAYFSAASAISAPEQGVHHPVKNISLVALEEPVSPDGIDLADAQMYITTKAFRYMWFGFGKLTDAQAKLLDLIDEGQEITSYSVFGDKENTQAYAKMQALLNSKKLIYGDGSTFLKMSAFTLTKNFTSIQNPETKKWEPRPNRVQLHNLREKLEAIENEKGNQTLGIAAPLSAIKMKKQKVNELTDLDNSDPFTNGYTNLDASFMGLQQLNVSNKLEQVDPTQIKQIITSEQDPKTHVPGLMMNVGEIITEYNKAISKRVTIKFQNKKNLTFSYETAMDEFEMSKDAGSITPKLSAYLNFAINGLQASQSSSQLLEFFSMDNGVQEYNLNNPITSKKFEQLFLSYFSKGVFSERIPGLALTLVSDFGNQVYRRVYEVEIVDGKTIPVRSEIIREKSWKGDSNDIQDLNTLTPESEGLSEGIVVLDRLRHGLKEYKDITDPDSYTGQRFTEMMMPSHHKSVMDMIENKPNAKMPDVISKMFAIRIPSQDNHSAMNVKWVDFLPVYYGSSAMFARELVEISGADFDIDKVFAQIKDFYVESGEFKEYGKAVGMAEKHKDYLRYISREVQKPGNTYYEAYQTYIRNQNASEIDNSVETDVLTDQGLISQEGLIALEMLGLPKTLEEYKNYYKKFQGEPYEAPYNNDILDYRYALLGNDNVTSGDNPISYTPATVNIIKDVLSELSGQSKVFKQRMQEDSVEVDNILGKIKAFKANKGASIGAIVLPNLYLSLLTEYGITLKNPLRINGKDYFDYKETLDDNGNRKQDTISALITMATDNAKDRLLSKLGLNRHSLGIVANLTALGINLKTSTLLVNHPTIQKLYNEALNKSEKTDPGIKKLVKDFIESTTGVDELLEVTDELLLDNINQPQNISAQDNVSILSLFLEAIELKDFTSKMGAATSLTKGIGRNIAEVKEKYKKIADLTDKDALMDLNPIYKSNTWYSQYNRMFNQLVEQLLPAVVLRSNASFTSILDRALKTMNTESRQFTSEVEEDVSLDLLSYLTIKAYQKNMLDNGTLDQKSFSNDLIYPSEYNITDVIADLKEIQSSLGQENLFLDNYVIPEKSSDVGNSTGLNLANANTFRNLSKQQKVDLQNDFSKLFGSLTTRGAAKTLINYMMVKDGFQLRYGSLLSSVSPFVLNDYLSTINSVESALKGISSFESIFGMSQDDLANEFRDNYLRSNISGRLLKTYNQSPITRGFGNKKEKIIFNRQEGILKMNHVSRGMGGPKMFIRVQTIEGATITLMLDSEATKNKKLVYNVIETYGSNSQTGIGFIFGDRPTHKEVRNYVRNKGNDVNQDPDASISFDAMDGAKAVQAEILQSENINITADENSIMVKLDPEAQETDIANTNLLLEQLGLNEVAKDQDELEANVIEDVDTSLPDINEGEAQLSLDFEQELDEQYPEITEFWDTVISTDKKALENLRANNIVSLEDLIEEYNRGTYASIAEFIDQIKNCNL